MLWAEGKHANPSKLSLSDKVAHIYAEFGVQLSKWQVWRLEKRFEKGDVWVRDEVVIRCYRGIVAR